MQEEKVQNGGQPGDAEPAEGEKSLEALLAEAHAKIEQQRDAMLRAVAEAENARKRAIAESASSQKYAIERFAGSLVPVVDSLEAALAVGQDMPQAAREGIELTLRQLLTAFQKYGVLQVDPAPGERFDPNWHQAMATVPSEGEPNTVASVMQKGYKLHERVLRPALVVVTKALENNPQNPISGPDTN